MTVNDHFEMAFDFTVQHRVRILAVAGVLGAVALGIFGLSVLSGRR